MRETAPSGSAAITLLLLGPELYLGILAETPPFPAEAALALNRGEKPVQQSGGIHDTGITRQPALAVGGQR